MPRISAIDQALIAQAKRNADRVTIISVGVSQYSYLAPLPGVTQDLRLMRDIFVNKRLSIRPSGLSSWLIPTSMR
jgi:hypothetical protein